MRRLPVAGRLPESEYRSGRECRWRSERELKRWILVDGDASLREAPSEEADGARKKRALNETGGDQREGDRDVT